MENNPAPDPYVLGQINANVAHLLESSRTQRDDFRRIAEDINKRIDGHDVRITKVEHSYWKIAGIVSIIPVVLTGLGMFLTQFTGG